MARATPQRPRSGGSPRGLGISEFTTQIRPQTPETYQELDEEVFSAVD